MKHTIIKIVSCIIAFLIFLIFNISVYYCLIYYQKKEYKGLLKAYASSISSLLTQDLENALNSSIPNKEFFLFKGFEVIPKSKTTVNLITVSANSIRVRNKKEEYIFNLHNLKEIINKIFPPFIIYKLSLNNHDIFSERINIDQYLTESKLVEANGILNLKLGIKKDSQFYLDGAYLLRRNMLIYSISSFLTLSILVSIYFKIYNTIQQNFRILHQEIYEETEINTALINNNKADHDLRKLFIKKLTEIYLKQELGDTYNPNDFPFKNQLFPINLTDLSLTKINIENLIKLLQGYFAPYFAKIGIRITNNIKEIEINCSLEVFYQLIFSLVFNLVKFIDRQSNIPQIIKIDFNQDKITITNDCFSLDEKKMIKLSDIIIEEYTDLFILNCYKIFKSLNEHKFKYNIFSHDGSHLIEIVYPPLNNSNLNTGKILDFTKYLNNKN